MSAARPAAAEPGHRRAGRALFDALETRLARSLLPARAALTVAATLGAARAFAAGRWPAPREVATLFGAGPLAARRLALAIAANEARHRLVVRRAEGRARAPIAAVVGWRDPRAAASLAPPAVLVSAHVGALHLLAPALDALPARRTVLRFSPLHLTSESERNATVAGGVDRRAQALLDAVAELRAGGFVSATFDGGYGAERRVRVLGRSLALGPAAFALSAWTGAAVVPVVALWERGGVVCELGAPVEGPAGAARWLEALLRRRPEQISLGLLRQLLFGPAFDAAAADPPGL